MPKARGPKFFSSLFFKLMVIILIAGIGINLSIIFFFGAFRHHIASSYQPHLARYIEYLLNDIGNPPDRDRARRLASETDMIIAFEGQGLSWSTADHPVTIPRDRVRIRHRDERLELGRYRGAQVVYAHQDDGLLTFYLPHQPDAERKIKVIGLGLLLYISALLVGAYLAIRWVLKPLQWLKQGVEQVGRGDLSHRVPLKRSDELRDLAKAFNTMAERLQQLIRSKEQLLLDVSHELRSPITRMKVALAMMPETHDRISLEEDLRELEEKITELLDTARALNVEAALNIEATDLADLIRLTAKQFYGGRPSVQVAQLANVGSVHIDRDRIGKALRNILENAQKYSPDDSAPVAVSMRSIPDAVAVTVRDSGVGIPAEDIDFIFEPFYRVDKARSPRTEGYGLGLSLAKAIIEAHGGRIEVHSTLGQGTEVVILLPHSVEDVSSAQGSP